MTLRYDIGLARVARTFAPPGLEVEPWPTIDWLSASVPYGDLESEAHELHSRHSTGVWLPLAGNPILDVLDFAGALDLAHLCGYVDINNIPILSQLVLILDRLGVVKFGPGHPVFGAAAQLRSRIASETISVRDAEVREYAACERYLVLMGDVRKDDAFEEFLRDPRTPDRRSHVAQEAVLAAPEAFAEALVRERAGNALDARFVSGGLHAVEYFATLADVLRALGTHRDARGQCLLNARWAHSVTSARRQLERWVEAMRGWRRSLPQMSDEELEDERWNAFVGRALIPLEADVAEWSLSNPLSPEDRLLQATTGLSDIQQEYSARAGRQHRQVETPLKGGNLREALAELSDIAREQDALGELGAVDAIVTRTEIAGILVRMGKLPAALIVIERVLQDARDRLPPSDELLTRLSRLREEISHATGSTGELHQAVEERRAERRHRYGAEET
jgi:hypothetical protein